jgi:hypothetical protein
MLRGASCSCDMNFELIAVKYAEEKKTALWNRNSALLKKKCSIVEEIKRRIKCANSLHKQHLSRAETMPMQRCRNVVKWKTWPTLILTKMIFLKI